MKKLNLLLGCIPLLALGGCTPEDNPTGVVRGIAASFVAGRAFDEARVALNRDNDAQLQRAGEELRLAANAGSEPELTNLFTVFLTSAAGQLSTQASLSSNADKDQLTARSDSKYRAALAFAPTKSPEKSLDPLTLNGLGYFLADRGSTRADFELAALYTHAAYKKWPVPVGSTPAQVSRAMGPQDSYAWALFKLKRYEQARVQQEQVLKLARSFAPNKITPEIPFHMAEIYRAMGEKEKARGEYEIALRTNPDADLKAKINFGIKALEFKQV